MTDAERAMTTEADMRERLAEFLWNKFARFIECPWKMATEGMRASWYAAADEILALLQAPDNASGETKSRELGMCDFKASGHSILCLGPHAQQKECVNWQPLGVHSRTGVRAWKNCGN